MVNDEQSMSEDTARFLQLVAMFQLAARQQMGKTVNPLTNEVERDLQLAKSSIDTLEMLKAKTKGNLSEVEKEFLDKVLFELHMEYVDEAAHPGEEESEEKSKETTEEKEEASGSGSDGTPEDRSDAP